MPKRKGIDPPSTEVIKIRIPIKVKIEALRAKEAGLHWDSADSSFFGFLLKLGLKSYQNHILPIEKTGGTPTETSENPPEYGIISKDIKEKAKRKGA